MKNTQVYRRETFALLLLAALALWSPTTNAEGNAGGDYDAGARKSFYCAYCHGYDGNPLDQRVPRLAGRKAEDIVARIQELKAKGTMHADMRKAFETGELSDQDVENLATFFSRQPVHR